jgi:hypothetical protein
MGRLMVERRLMVDMRRLMADMRRLLVACRNCGNALENRKRRKSRNMCCIFT